MATKIVVGMVAMLVLAISGTVGVAYYNDPSVFDCPHSAACCPSDSSSCCSQASEAKSCCANEQACDAACEK